MIGELVPSGGLIPLALGAVVASVLVAMIVARLLRQKRDAAHIRLRLTEVTAEAPQLTVVETGRDQRLRTDAPYATAPDTAKNSRAA